MITIRAWVWDSVAEDSARRDVMPTPAHVTRVAEHVVNFGRHAVIDPFAQTLVDMMDSGF